MLIGIQPTTKPYIPMGHHRNGSWFFRTWIFLTCAAPFLWTFTFVNNLFSVLYFLCRVLL